MSAGATRAPASAASISAEAIQRRENRSLPRDSLPIQAARDRSSDRSRSAQGVLSSMRLFTANGAHISCTESVSALPIVGGAHRARGIDKESHPEFWVSAPNTGSVEAVYYGTGAFRVPRTTTYTEKP